MKKILALCLALLMITGIFSATAEEFKGQIYIGVSCAITGDTPLEGERTKQAITMAFEEANAAGGINGYEVVGLFEDDSNTTNGTVTVYNKFGSDERVLAVIGPTRSTSVLAVDEIIKRYGLPALSIGTSPKFETLNNPYLFRGRLSDAMVPIVVAKFCIEELGCSKIGLIYNNDDFGSGALQSLEAYCAELEGVELVAAEGHNTGDKDMYAQLLACKDAGADVIIGWTHAPEGAVIARQYKELGLDETIEFAGCSTWCNTSFYDLVDESVPDGTYAAVYYTAANPDAFPKAFTERFIERWGVEPENLAGCYYDCARIVLDALQRAADNGELTRDSVRDALATVSDVTGNQGPLYATGQNLAHSTCIIKNNGNVPEYITQVTE